MMKLEFKVFRANALSCCEGRGQIEPLLMHTALVLFVFRTQRLDVDIVWTHTVSVNFHFIWARVALSSAPRIVDIEG